VHTSYEACVKNRQVAPEAAVALHVDARKITDFLERHLQSVEVVEAEKIEVQTADGRVSGLSLDGTQTLSADLYVDCTGFARAVYGKVAPAEMLTYEANV